MNDSVLFWTLIGTWGNAVAMGTAAFFAWRAWREQKKTGEAEHRRNASDSIGQFLDALTTGKTAASRDRVTSWNMWNLGSTPPGTGDATPAHPMRAHSLLDHEEAKTRRAVFDLLWSIHRSSALVDDAKIADHSTRNVLRHHLDLVVVQLDNFAPLLGSREKEIFRESAKAARGALIRLGSVLDADWINAFLEFRVGDVVEPRHGNS